MIRGLRTPPPLPGSFIFGVSTADHQSEAYLSEYEDVRDVWERKLQQTPRGRATDFWTRYQEDVELARGLGCKGFRFSIAWSRIEPTPGAFNPIAIDHYRRLIASIREAGLEPLLTLHHFTWPKHVEERGGMSDDSFPNAFERYVAKVAECLGREVRYWITFNEPTQLILGYFIPQSVRDGFMPPGWPAGASLAVQAEKAGRLIRSLFRAHALARSAIKRVNPDAMVGANPLLLGLPVWLQSEADRRATLLRDRDELARQGRRFAEPSPAGQGKVDVVVAALTATRERAREVAFSEVYFVAGQVLLVRSTSPVSVVGDLIGKRVIAVKGSTAERDVRDLIPSAQVRVVASYAAALAELDHGRADALLADDTIQGGLMLQHPGQYRLVGDRLTGEPYAVAVAFGDRALLAAANAAVRRFKLSGGWTASYSAHFGQPVPTPPEPPFPEASEASIAASPSESVPPTENSGQAMRRIRERGYLTAAVRDDVPGLGYRDPSNGELAGLEIDLAREIAREILGDPDKIQFRAAATRERLLLLRSIARLLDPIVQTYRLVTTGLAGNWWHLGMAGQLPEYLCPAGCSDQQDFVGFDYYWGIPAWRIDLLLRLLDAGSGHFDRAPVYPARLHDLLKYHARLLPGKPILIAENGSVVVADGVDRATYVREHVRQVQRAAAEGVSVAGYFCWSITSNREWGLPFRGNTDFGLYHVDLDADPVLARRETPSAVAYRKIIAERGV